jgi:ABC-type nitrate/sulfonate/bicarbonate transport system substrate-binding protein
VQALVTAMAQATQYAHTNSADAAKIVSGQLGQIGITDQSEQHTLFQDYLATATTYPSQTAFNATANFLRSAEPVSIQYADFIDPAFATKAYEQLNLSIPAGG